MAASSPARPAASAPTSYFERYIEPAVMAALSPVGPGPRRRRDEAADVLTAALSPARAAAGAPAAEQHTVRRSAAARERPGSSSVVVAASAQLAAPPSAAGARMPDDAGLKARAPRGLCTARFGRGAMRAQQPLPVLTFF